MRTSHPAERFAFAIFTMLICLATGNYLVNLAVIAVMIGLLVFKAAIPARVIAKLMLVPVGFLIIGVLAIAILISSSNEGMLLNIKVGNYFLGVTENSLMLAGSTILKSISAVSALYFLVLTTPMIEIIYVLQLLRFPSIILELMILMYRFIFVFLETAFYIYTSQSARLGYCSFKRSINSFGLLFANLWGKTFVKSQALCTSLLSRGYDRELKVLYPTYTLSTANVLFFLLIDLVLIAISL
jgi:cobalt/nickel transport system permease protein